MNQSIFYKGSKYFFCSKCGIQTPHYVRANGEGVICLSCGDERPVKQLVQALRVNQGGPERHLG